jgi:hypothetical protein
MNQTLLNNKVAAMTTQYYDVPFEPEPTYEEKLEGLGEHELVRTLVKSGMESVVLELIVKKLIERHNELIKRRTQYKAVSEALLKSKVPEEYAKGIQLKGECKAITEEIADFLIENLDGNYDYSPSLREIVRFNSIEVD